jgi:hypothetical protein
MRLQGWSLGLTIAGLVLVVFSLVWLLAIFPVMSKMPTDYEREYKFEGFIMQLNSETMSLDEIPTDVDRILTATGTEDDVLLLQQDINIYHAQAGTLLSSTSDIYGLDRTTRENVPGYGDMDRSGNFTLPAGVEKETYSFWSSSAMTALPANFVSEETYHGITVYNFKIDVSDLPAGTMEGTGAPRTMDVLTEIKAEPVSGIPVYTSTTTTLKAQLMPGDPTTIYVNSMAFTSETIDEMVDLAKDTRTLILWATFYGFWIVIGMGAALVIAGVVMAVRAREE